MQVNVNNLIFIIFLLSLLIHGVDTNFFIIFLQSCHVFTGFRELTFFHTLSNIPMHESTLGIHKIELMIKTSPSFGNRSGVAQHAHCSLDLGKITTRHNSRWLVVDTNFETSGTPVDKLDGTFGLDGCNGSIDILGDDVTTEQQTTSHVLAMTRITFHHLVGWLEASVGDLGNGELLVVGLLGGDDWGIGSQREVDTWVWYQVGLELSQVDVQGTIESQGGGDGGDDLTNQSVQVGVGWSLDVQVTSADVVDGLVVDHEGAVGVLQGSVGRQDGVVWLNNSGGHLRGGVDGELQLGLLAVVDTESLHQQGGEPGPGAAAEGVEDEEALESSALVSQLPDAVKDQVNDLLADGVVTSGVVVGGIFLAGDELFWVEQLAVCAGPHLIDNRWLEVDKDGPGDVLACAGLAEEGVEGVVSTSDGLVRRHLAIRLDPVLQAVQLPAGIADLHSGLTNVDRDTFTHDVGLGCRCLYKKGRENVEHTNSQRRNGV